MRCDHCGNTGWVWTLEPTTASEGGDALCPSCLAEWVDNIITNLRTPWTWDMPSRANHVHCDNCPDDRIPWVWTAPNGQAECAECVAERMGHRPEVFTEAFHQAQILQYN